MNKFIKMTLVILTIISLNGCSTDINQYSDVSKPFDIKDYFNGPVVAWGMVQDYSNKVTRRFCVEIEGSWQGNQGLLAETFYFDDGEVSYRNWQLLKLKNGAYQGTAGDVIGTANGQHSGFAFHWEYQLKVPVDDGVYIMHMDDWMYQLDHDRVFNKTKMKKLGVTVADITLFFDKSSAVKRCQP
ncbi:MAG: DUF3833 domain-containing protein [Alteromonadales bacterium]|nr:DUF3833 domain-containing protein [Alteromonadales bacterium]